MASAEFVLSNLLLTSSHIWAVASSDEILYRNSFISNIQVFGQLTLHLPPIRVLKYKNLIAAAE